VREVIGDAAFRAGDPLVESRVCRGGSLGQLVQLMVLLRVYTLMLLEILWTLERLAAYGAWMRFEWSVDCQEYQRRI